MLIMARIVRKLSAVAAILPLVATALQNNAEEGQLSIASMQPSFGDLNGGTPVILSLDSNQPSVISHCIFGDEIVEAKSLGKLTIQCTSPPMIEAEAVPVGLSIDGKDFSMSTFTFDYKLPASFSAFTPDGGPELGGTLVTITGTNFVRGSEFACYFGDNIKSEANWVSEEEMTCTTPKIRPGYYDLRVSFNGVDIHDTAFLYRAYLQMTALAAVPSFAVQYGGTEISVYGTNFMWENNLQCRFGDSSIVSGTVVGSNLLKCVTPMWNVAESVELSIVSDKGDVAMLDEKFELYAPFQLSSFAPNNGFLRGGTIVTIQGSHFAQDRGPLQCSFGEVLVEARIKTDNQIQCTSPSSIAARDIQIVIYHGSDEFKLESSVFSYDNEIWIDDSPNVVALSNAAKELAVHGSSFRNTTDLVCSLNNDILLDAKFVNGTHVDCLVPAGLRPGEYQLAVSNNGQEFSSSIQSVRVIDPFRMHVINPSIQSIDLVSKVRIEGRNFVDLVGCACVIDEEHVTQYHFLSPTAIECSMPENIRLGTSSVNLSLDGMPLSIGPPLSFTIVDLTISSIFPSFGDSNGGTPVMFEVNEEAMGVISHCIFGDQIVPAVKLVSGIFCTTPPTMEVGSVSVGLSVTEGKDFSMSTHTFDFTSPARFNTLTPSNGPELGGTVVTVSGSNFVNSTNITCYFGDVKATGKLISDEKLECISPAMRPGSYDLRISFNTIDTLRTYMKFLFNYELDVLSVTPSLGSIMGGTNVSIIGKSYVPMEFLSCRFGNFGIVQAIFISSTEISCASPDVSDRIDNASVVDIQVSLNGVDFSPAIVQFQYSLPASVNNIHPMQGSINGGTEVIVKGDHFIPSTQPLCAFGDSFVPAIVHSDSEMSCLSPKYKSVGATPFSISLNGVDQVVGTGKEINFTFLPIVQTISVTPNSGPIGGGTTVTVEGIDFHESLNIRCKFGKMHPVDAKVISDNRVECKSQSHPFGIVPLVISSEKTDVVSIDAVFEFYKPPRIISAYPSSGPLHGNTPVKVHGDFFRSSTEYLCHFGNNSVQGEYISASSILCPSPAMRSLDNIVDLTITDRDANFTQDSLTFSYVQPPALISLSPVHVFFEGGDSVEVLGHGFNSTNEVWCRFTTPLDSLSEVFDTIKVRAISVLDDKRVVCMTPSYPPIDEQIEILLSLSTNGHDWSTNSLPVYYVPNLSIIKIYPSLGTIDGGTMVTVHGTGYFEGDDLWCNFGAAGSMPTTLVSYTEVICMSPPTSVPRNVSLSLNFKGSDSYVTSDQSFIFHRQLSLLEAKPLRGFISGGTSVTITGTGFVDVPSLSCRFGKIVMKAKFISRSMIECFSPPANDVSMVDLSVSLNGVDYVTRFMDTDVVFIYDSEITLNSASPHTVVITSPSQEAVKGSEERNVTLYGDGFVNTTSLSCMFGSDKITSATFITKAKVKCNLPLASDLGQFPVRLSMNGVDFGTQAVKILFVPPTRITDIYPKRIQEGSEVDLLISGDNFVRSSETRCYFGSNDVSKSANWMSNSTLMCTSPPLNLTYDGYELLRLSSNDGFDMSNSYPLGVTARSRFLSIRPNTGYHGGGTKVSITLSTVQYVSNLSCQFGEIKVAADLISANNIECISPSYDAAGIVTVKVLSDDIHLLAAGSFEYLIPPVLTTLYPKMGLVEGRSTVSASGSNLDGLTHCRFSQHDGRFEVTRVISGNDTTVMCQVPFMNTAHEALVQVSHNEQDFIGRDLRFTFKKRPRIFSITPSFGSDTGGKTVHISGENFIQGAMMIHFGDTVVSASVVSPNLMSCKSPMLKLGLTPVSVSVIGMDYFVGNETLTYESIQLPQIGAIRPNVGIIGGHTHVIVNTTKLFKMDRLSCHFDDKITMAVSTSPNSVSCLAPTTQDFAETVNVSISIDGERHGGDGDSFTFVSEPKILSTYPSIGWTTGGDEIYFQVEGMTPFSSSKISCLFGGSSDRVYARIDVEDNIIICVAPSFEENTMRKRAEMSLIIDDGINTVYLTATEYTYLEPAIVTKIHPPYGTIRGGTVVKATGISFESMRGLSLSCLFGNVAVQAEIENENEVICVAPEWKGGSKKNIVSIGIGNNTEMILESHASYTYLLQPSISNIQPRFGDPIGGTAVAITGHALIWPDASKYLSCQFGNTTFVPVTVVNEGLQCITPPLLDTSMLEGGAFDTNVTLYAKHGGIPLASSDELFVYTTGMTISTLSINSGPYSGGTDVTIPMTSFRGLPTEFITCNFDDVKTRGHYFTVGKEEYVKCTTPVVKGAKSSKVVVLRLGIEVSDIVSNGELFTFYSPPIVRSVFPSYGFFEGGEEVLVTGTYFRNTTSLSCYFGDEPSPRIEWVSDTSLLCTSPPPKNKVASQRVNVSITNNGVDFTHASTFTEYAYSHRPDPTFVWPNTMNEKNRTSVVIRGKGLARVEACQFIKHKSQAFNVTDNSFYCDVPVEAFEGPPQSIPIFIVLENGVIPTSLDIRYEAPPVIPEVIEEPIVIVVEPTSGASAGGGWIRVNGEGFLSRTELACMFGETVSNEVQYISSAEVLCKVPKHLPGKVGFSVTNGGQRKEIGNSKFTFVSDISITAIFPSSGSIEGGTKVHIYGSFTSLHTLGFSPKCKFGTAGVVEGVLVSQNEIYCISPPAAVLETVELRLSVDNGYNFVLSSSWFIYTLASEVESLSPNVGFRSGGTPILVTGRNFRNEKGLACKFGGVSVSATFISSEKISCVTPPNLDGEDNKVMFTLGSDSGDSSNWKHFEYMDDIVIESVQPSIGTSLGGADVVMKGTGFQKTSQLYCAFDDINIQADMVDSSTMLCKIPRHRPEIVSFRVVDQFDRTLVISEELSSRFEFVPEPSIEAINTNSNGNVIRAGLIFARGSNFGNAGDMSCVFGDLKQLSVIVLAEQLLICETPNGGKAKMENVSITHRGSVYSSQSVLTADLDGLSIAPNGTTIGFNVTLCEPGTFNPRSGGDVCLLCPVGYICPWRGMSQPILCPSGHICSKIGLVSSSSPCRAGHYCPEGTKSSNPMANVESETWLLDDESGVPTAALERSLWDHIPRFLPATGFRRFFHPPVNKRVRAEQPLPCPVSHYCRKGVKASHPRIEGDYSTPQRCLSGYFCPRGSITPEGSGPCPAGHYCPDNYESSVSAVIPLAIPCDIGHYCPGTGNAHPKECFPGSYSPATGRSTCVLCEVGRQCPGWGMSEPELCQAGFVCDIEGIATPTKLCPGGYVCEEGTSTDKPYISLTLGVGPKPCPPGSACPSGTAHNVTGSWLPSFELGRIAPQPCSEGFHCPQNSSSILGAGQCPPGHYCPPRSAFPVKVPPGTYAGEEGGAIAPSLCLPGTFSPQSGAISCKPCPAGYSCLSFGTYKPRICQPGTFRSKEDSLTCKQCPQRTFSPYSGLTDISQCIPCTEGRVCSSKGMSDIGLSHSCPEGHECGYLTDGGTQYNHKCAAGQYCGEETTTLNQYNKFCVAGTFCERGTTETLRNKNECNRGYFCSSGTPSPESNTNRCPRQTTSLLGSESMSMCYPESVAICDKMLHIETNLFHRMVYYPINEASVEDTSPTREMAVVHKVLPLNPETSSVELWNNDTIEVIRACPSYIVQPGWTPKPSYGVRTEDANDDWKEKTITIIGRNFRNSTTLTCRYRRCLNSGWKSYKGMDIVVPGNCFADLKPSSLSRAETSAGTFISDTRISCPLPPNEFEGKMNPINVSNGEEFFSQSFCLRDDNGRPYLLQKCSEEEVALGQCSRDEAVPAMGLGKRVYSLFAPCSKDDISQGLCTNVPSPLLKLNPCFTSQLIVDVSNNGDKFSSKPRSTMERNVGDSSAFEGPQTYATYYVIDEHMLDTFESEHDVIDRRNLISSFRSDELLCNITSSHEEEHRLDDDGWFEAVYMNQFHLSFDWRLLPKHFVYDEHFRLAIYVAPSRCGESQCSASTRHIQYEENIPCLQPVQLPEWFTNASIDKNQFMNLTLLALDDSRFRVEVQLTHGLALPFADFFERTMTVIRRHPQRAKVDTSTVRTLSPLISWEENSVDMPWIFGIYYDTSYSHVTSLPMNLPPRWKSFERGRVLVGMNTTHENTNPTIKDSHIGLDKRRGFWSNPFQSELIAKEQTDRYFETFHGLSLDETTGSYEFDMHSLVLPYLPYFSNCREFDSYIPLWALVESSTDCNLPRVSSQYPDTWWRRSIQPLPHQDDVVAIGPSDFMSFYPVADWCERKLQCSYEESLVSTDVIPRWFEADSGSVLFSILRDPIDYYQYTGREAAIMGTNDGGGQKYTDTITTLETFVPAKVSRSPAFNVVGDCAASCFPRRVTVDISYYQMDSNSKRIVQVNVIYDKFDKDMTNDKYELKFKFYPLNYQELVTKFAFTRGLFMMLFSYIGVGTVAVALIYWALLRLTTSLENPPHLRILGYLWLTFPQAFGGLLLGLIPISLVTAASFYLVKGYTLDASNPDSDGRRWLFATTKLQYSDVTINPDLIHLTRQGRTGLAFFTMAVATFYFTAKMFVPNRESGVVQDDKPITTKTWQRSNLLVSSVLMSLLLVGIVEASFFESFGTYIWEAQILIKFLGVIIGQIMDKQLGEVLLSTPVMTAFGLIQAVVTMSANDFMDFLLSYIVGFGFLLLERMYIGPLLPNILDWFSETFSALAKYTRRLIPTRILNDQNDHSASESDSVAVYESNEETLEPLLGNYASYSSELLSLMYFPFIMVVIMIFREEAEMMKLYNIKESDMEYYLLFALVIIPFQIMADIFMQNSLELLHGWKTYEYLEYCRVRFLQREMWWKGLEANTLDECIEKSLRSVDQQCFSSQYYMLNTLHVNAMVYLVLGIVMMARAKYNAFGDPAMTSIVMIILLCSVMVKFVLTWLAMFIGLWSIRHEKRKWHYRVQVDGEPKLEQLSHEEPTGHDEYRMEARMTSDAFRYKFLRYNRSWIIEQLPDVLSARDAQRSRPYVMNQFARILGSIDAGISSDSEADDAPEFEVPNMNASTRAMLRTWFGEATRLLRLSRLVEPIIQQSKGDMCHLCLSRSSLRVETCFSVEEMNRQFINEYPECSDDIDQVLWKRFWQRTQKYQTICFPCLQKRARDRITSLIDDDRSSDDADSLGDLVTSELDNASSAILTTWLTKARSSLNN